MRTPTQESWTAPSKAPCEAGTTSDVQHLLLPTASQSVQLLDTTSSFSVAGSLRTCAFIYLSIWIDT